MNLLLLLSALLTALTGAMSGERMGTAQPVEQSASVGDQAETRSAEMAISLLTIVKPAGRLALATPVAVANAGQSLCRIDPREVLTLYARRRE